MKNLRRPTAPEVEGDPGTARGVTVARSARPGEAFDGLVSGLGKLWRGRASRSQARSTAEADRAILAAVVESSTDAIISVDLDFLVTSWNPGADTLLGWTAEETIGRPLSLRNADGLPPREGPEMLAVISAGGAVGAFETVRLRKDGTPVEVSVLLSPIRDRKGTIVGVSIIGRDITERKRIDRLHERTSRALATLSAANIALVRARTQDGLYQRMCDILVETGGYRMAWVGAADDNARKSVTPVGSAGHDDGYLSTIRLSWADVADGRGPIGTAIREKRTQIIASCEHAGPFGPWRADALERGYRSIIALPLADGDDVLGALTIYAADTEAFGPEETALLEELAADLAFGVVTLRDRQVRDSLAAIVESSSDAIFGVSLDGVITSWNPGAEAIYRYAAAEVIGRDLRQLVVPEARARVERIFDRAQLGQEPEPFELEHMRRDGQPIAVSITGSLTHDLTGKIIGIAAIARDITEHKRIEAELIRAARLDSLTGLLNRAAFTEAVRAATAADPGGGPVTAVLLLNLDNFKDVNDSLGHGVGDALLQGLSDRLQRRLASLGAVARFGGDEFAVLLERIDESRIEAVAQDVLDTIATPFDIDDADIRIGASLGVAVSGPGAESAEGLLSQADIALSHAKDQGRGLFLRFTEAMDVAVRRRVTLGRDLRTAIDGGQLWLAYQPQVDGETGAIIGVEALARWRHPERGPIDPAEFIPIAESLGLATAIGRWVIDEACRQVRAWLHRGLSPPPVAINLSATQFTPSGELEGDLESALARHRLTPGRLELELTETVLMKSSADHGATLVRLQARGFRLSIDDFGTGYSSLDYLRWFPADRIKIDQNFVKDIGSTPGAEAIVRTIIGLARQLGMEVIAEGVETSAHRDLLRLWDCREMQGYYFSRPAPAEAIAGLLASGRSLPLQGAVD